MIVWIGRALPPTRTISCLIWRIAPARRENTKNPGQQQWVRFYAKDNSETRRQETRVVEWASPQRGREKSTSKTRHHRLHHEIVAEKSRFATQKRRVEALQTSKDSQLEIKALSCSMALINKKPRQTRKMVSLNGCCKQGRNPAEKYSPTRN